MQRKNQPEYLLQRGRFPNYPDFIVKKTDTEYFIVEAKGREDPDVPLKIKRLKLWCEDINQAQKAKTFDFIFVDEENFKKYNPSSFEQLVNTFREYKD